MIQLIKRRGTDAKWMWQYTEKEAGMQVSMEKIEQWEVLEIQTKVYGKSTNLVGQDVVILSNFAAQVYYTGIASSA